VDGTDGRDMAIFLKSAGEFTMYILRDKALNVSYHTYGGVFPAEKLKPYASELVQLIKADPFGFLKTNLLYGFNIHLGKSFEKSFVKKMAASYIDALEHYLRPISKPSGNNRDFFIQKTFISEFSDMLRLSEIEIPDTNYSGLRKFIVDFFKSEIRRLNMEYI
jgi:hypothetical protein